MTTTHHSDDAVDENFFAEYFPMPKAAAARAKREEDARNRKVARLARTMDPGLIDLVAQSLVADRRTHDLSISEASNEEIDAARAADQALRKMVAEAGLVSPDMLLWDGAIEAMREIDPTGFSTDKRAEAWLKFRGLQ